MDLKIRWGRLVSAALLLAILAGIGAGLWVNYTPATAGEPIPALNASRWTGADLPTDANGLVTGLGTFIAAAGAADHLDDPQRSLVAGIAPVRWTKYQLVPDADLNRRLITLGEIAGFDAAVYRINGMVLVAFAGSGPFLSTAGFNDWLVTDGGNMVIGLVNRTVGPTTLSSEAVYQYGLGRLLVEAVQRQLQPGERLYLVGHSLGGGIAALAGGQLSIPTVTFNTAAITLAADAKFDPDCILNLQIEGDLAGLGGRIEGINVVFRRGSGPLAPEANPPWDWHDMVIFDHILAAAKKRELQFSGYSSAGAGLIRRGGGTFFVGGA